MESKQNILMLPYTKEANLYLYACKLQFSACICAAVFLEKCIWICMCMCVFMYQHIHIIVKKEKEYTF